MEPQTRLRTTSKMKTSSTSRRLNREAAHELIGTVPTADSLHDFDSHEQAVSASHARRRSLAGGRRERAPGLVCSISGLGPSGFPLDYGARRAA